MRKVTGNLINAYYVCQRQLWLYAHELIPDQDYSFLELGRLYNSFSYRKDKKEITTGDIIKIDLLKHRGSETVIAEVKKSSRFKLPARMQLAFYLYRLREMGIDSKGELLIPKEKKRIPVVLDENTEKELKKAFSEIENILSQEVAPEPRKIKFCKNCAYREFCWV